MGEEVEEAVGVAPLRLSVGNEDGAAAALGPIEAGMGAGEDAGALPFRIADSCCCLVLSSLFACFTFPC